MIFFRTKEVILAVFDWHLSISVRVSRVIPTNTLIVKVRKAIERVKAKLVSL